MTDDLRIESLEDRVNEIETTLYGNRREKNGGGLYGRVARLEAEFGTRPRGWVTLVIIGGAASMMLDIVILAILASMLVR